MKTRLSAILLGLVTGTSAIAATSDPTVALQPPVSADSLSTSAIHLRQQTDRLFLGNDRLGDQSMTMASSINAPVSNKDPMTAKNAASTEDILALDPYDVTAGKTIVLPPTFHVTPQNFVRTGVIAMHESKKVTTYLWAKGDDGLMFTLSF